MPKTNKSIGFMGGEVAAPSNHHNFEPLAIVMLISPSKQLCFDSIFYQTTAHET